MPCHILLEQNPDPDYIALNVRFRPESKARRNLANLAVVGLMLCLWLGTFALTISPQLHGLLHDDADSGTHTCLVTHLHQHSPLPSLVSVPVPAPPRAWLGSLAATDFHFPPHNDYRLSPSRAPPPVPPTLTIAG